MNPIFSFFLVINTAFILFLGNEVRKSIYRRLFYCGLRQKIRHGNYDFVDMTSCGSSRCLLRIDADPNTKERITIEIYDVNDFETSVSEKKEMLEDSDLLGG
jgi:hypothetical protein